MTESPATSEPAPSPAHGRRAEPPLPALALRSGVGGALMGLANLVPGISGGTMLLAAGVYPRFVAAVGEVTRLKLQKTSLVVLAMVAAAALAAIGLLAEPVKHLVVQHRWVMYSLFIGLTLGGVPVIWRLIRAGEATAETPSPNADRHGEAGPDHARTPRESDPGSTAASTASSVWLGAACGFAGMAALAVWQTAGAGSQAHNDGHLMLFLAGVAGASAMILPGVSGGYLLLVLGVYVPILGGISAFKDALQNLDIAAIVEIGTQVILPVGLGALLGVMVVSNLLAWFLRHHRRATLGVLLGLLVGGVVGLWPFQAPMAAEAGMSLKGQTLVQGVDAESGEPGLVYDATGKTVEAEDLPTAFFRPAAPQIGGAVLLAFAGLGITLLIDRLGREKPQPAESA